jgi:hypothetical protein|tara:strand:+ start:678 stop:926 length:249 start_codon:yes stop_codon:yes gene_type:complete
MCERDPKKPFGHLTPSEKMKTSLVALALASSASAFTIPASGSISSVASLRGGRSPSMIEITNGVEFDTIARGATSLLASDIL